MAEESWDNTSSNDSPLEIKHTNLRYHDSDSYVSVSPSPDVDSKKKSFSYCSSKDNSSGNLTAALQTEKEFLDFMFSLPHLRTESSPKEQEPQQTLTVKHDPVAETHELQTTKCLNSLVGNTSRVGLDHLDNLCKMMEQLGELREQNMRLQKRVQYLEEIKALQEMHSDIESSRKNTLSLGPVSLSDSDLRLDDLSDFCLYRQNSEDSLDLLEEENKELKDEDLLEPPDSQLHLRRSSSDDDRSRIVIEQNQLRKEKKGHRSAWGKVKHMIVYSKRDGVRKKSSELMSSKNRHVVPSLKNFRSSSSHHQMSSSNNTTSGNAPQENLLPNSDAEEYDFDYESCDPDGTSWEWEGDTEAGIWIGQKSPTENMDSQGPIRNFKDKIKPQLTITVPSSEDLSFRKVTSNTPQSSEGKVSLSSGSSMSKLEQKSSPEVPMTPTSPRRPSNWTKVKKAFLTGYPIQHLPNKTLQAHNAAGQLSNNLMTSGHSPPLTPTKKEHQAEFTFDGVITQDGDCGNPNSQLSSPDVLPGEDLNRSPKTSKSIVESASGMQKNLVDLQRTLTGEFNKKLQEWEKLKSSHEGGGSSIPGRPTGGQIQDENLPHEFKKKLHEWEKRKNRDKEKIRLGIVQHQPTSHHLLHLGHTHHGPLSYHNDVKMKKHEEEDLPPDFKKKLAEWQIRKALVGKNQQNVEELQKNLGEEFNRKMAEWEKMKALGQAKSNGAGEFQDNEEVVERGEMRRVRARGSLPVGTRLTNLAIAAGGGSFIVPPAMDRKGSASKVKKNKSTKIEKTSVAKAESTQRHRDKELQWLEKELNKIDREKQRLEREKEKFLEREARLEKMRHAMRQGPVEKKEIYIKTSNGEFRFEGISQTFTKKLYEWEERRGIRPESSTFILLDPEYRPADNGNEKQRSPEQKRIARSRSESSLAEITPLVPSAQQSRHSLNEIDQDEQDTLQVENKAASEPNLTAEENLESQNCAVVVHMERKENESPEGPLKILKRTTSRSSTDPVPPYEPKEITKLIDSSESEENVGRRLSQHRDLCRSESLKSEEEYRSLLHENMTLLGKLKEQENLCRALESQMGDIDNKMDSVADQHLKTLEKLHRQVTIMRKSESFAKRRSGSQGDDRDITIDDNESNQRLIEQLKARILELEVKGDKLMEDKEQLECAFKLHKEQEAEIAESLLMRIRELQEAGAEVNIQTVHCQTEDLVPPDESHGASGERKGDVLLAQSPVMCKKKRKRRKEDDMEKEGEESDDEKEESDDKEDKGRRKTEKEKKRKRKTPPKKVQKLHSLTADLLFQAKRLEQALVSKHHFTKSEKSQDWDNTNLQLRKRSLKGQSSLRLMKDESGFKQIHKKLPSLSGSNSCRSWASIEAIISNEENHQDSDSIWERRAAALASESQDLLAMNAELSRMAKELRREMTNLWSLRESTSPDSNSSEDNREEVLKQKNRLKEEQMTRRRKSTEMEESTKKTQFWLDDEAKNVFENIASLQSKESLSSFSDHHSTYGHKERSSPTDSHSRITDHNETLHSGIKSWIEPRRRCVHPIEDDNIIVAKPENANEEFATWWNAPLPRKRKKTEKISANSKPLDHHENSSDILSYRTSEKHSLGPEPTDFLRAESVESIQRSNSEQVLALNIIPCSSSEASSMSSSSDEPQAEIHYNHEDSEDGSSNSSLKTNQYSTMRSEILSSSFEFEEGNKPMESNCEHVQENNMSFLDKRPTKMNYSLQQLKKVNTVVEEASRKLQLETNRDVGSDLNKDGYYKKHSSNNYKFNNSTHSSQLTKPHDFQTEVTEVSIRERKGNIGLRTRRVSDTQIQYEQSKEDISSEKDASSKIVFSTLDSSVCKKVERHPSIRRNQSESDMQHSNASSIYCKNEIDGSVFVPTHRTIFNVYGESMNKNLNENNSLNEEGSFKNDSDESTINVTICLKKPKKKLQDSVIASDNKISDTEMNLCKDSNKTDEKRISSESKDSSEIVTLSSSTQTISTSELMSDKTLLDASTETSPTVKNMIEQYSKRITENQELLINPFKPGDPFTNKKASLPLEKNTQWVYRDRRIQSETKGPKDTLIYKSQSASALSQYISNGIKLQPNPLPIDEFSSQNSSALSCLETALKPDEIDNENSNKSDETLIRLLKLKKAKEDFLASGVAPLEAVKKKESFRSCSVVPSKVEGRCNSSMPSPNFPTMPPAKPPRILEAGSVNIPRKPSFRRQSDGDFPIEENLGGVTLQSTPSSPKIRSPSQERKGISKLASKGFLNFFKRSKGKKEKETVRQLCRQSLVVDINTGKKRKDATIGNLLAKPSTSTADNRTSMTLPRNKPIVEETSASTSTRSCPSSPVAPHRLRNASTSWLEKGRTIFKSPSSSKRPR